ncbi:hypothetical protein MRX96_008703 [Rhipicephalus microplus]
MGATGVLLAVRRDSGGAFCIPFANEEIAPHSPGAVTQYLLAPHRMWAVSGGLFVVRVPFILFYVRKIASRVCQSETQIKRISEGRYCIGGRIYFVRLLKEKHVMIRVGGGWDTLEHFLSRHDTCNVILLNRRSSSASEDGSHSPSSGSTCSLLSGTPSPLGSSSGNSTPAGMGLSRPRYRSPASSVSLSAISSLSKQVG